MVFLPSCFGNSYLWHQCIFDYGYNSPKSMSRCFLSLQVENCICKLNYSTGVPFLSNIAVSHMSSAVSDRFLIFSILKIS